MPHVQESATVLIIIIIFSSSPPSRIIIKNHHHHHCHHHHHNHDHHHIIIITNQQWRAEGGVRGATDPGIKLGSIQRGSFLGKKCVGKGEKTRVNGKK